MKSNKIMSIFSAMMIIMVVLGHTGGGTLEVLTNWFPIASFHMPAFLFISGYFYKNENADHLLQKKDNYIIKKVKHLLVPYFLWNLFYGIFVFLLKKCGVVNFGLELSFKNLFIEPWVSGHQFAFNCPSWFVPQLFLIQIVYVLIQKIINVNRAKSNIMKVVFGIVIFWGGFSCVEVAYNCGGGFRLGSLGWILVRTGFLLPFYHLGYVYKNRFESIHKKHIGFTTVLIFGIQFIVLTFFGWNSINFSAVSCVFQTSVCILPYIAAINGIIFWLSIANLVVASLNNCKVINYISENTWTIMMHHLTAIFLCNIMLWFVDNYLYDINFDLESFKIDQYYMCLITENMKVIYALFGIFVPLGIKYLFTQFKTMVIGMSNNRLKKEKG